MSRPLEEKHDGPNSYGPIGRLTQKHHLHDSDCVKTPLSKGPATLVTLNVPPVKPMMMGTWCGGMMNAAMA
ncbi:hypothetical protein I7I53_10778 [Histoplasma capsulatum var. duboisii H88]|uniref:Uncharacterized protein n=1 Tax=Ajellomyces capsulatus (strain H88) TaxID=544711 RepID=A0A8A1LCK3_AJEC8|nr:hypothetical protein I7I53_10778 [Histoplasma capsulatum var. duboisii H88]